MNKYLNNIFVNLYQLIQKKTGLKKIKSLMYYIDRVLVLFCKKPKLGKKKSIIIIFNLALGDGVVLVNALYDLRKEYPKDKYNLSIGCQKGLENIYEKLDIFDEVIPLNFTKGTVNLKERLKIIKKLREKKYTIVLDPIGANECLTNVLMTRNIIADRKIGCIIKNIEKNCSKHILKKTYNEIKTIKSNSLIEQYFEFFYKEYKATYVNLPSEEYKKNLPNDYYIVFPSASTKLKKWPVERYAEIIKKINQKTKMPLVFCGTNVDREEYDKLKKLIKNVEIIDIVGKTSLLEFIDVIKKAKFVISNDTGTYHIALISGVPTAIITGGYTYDRYVTYNFKSKKEYKKPYVIVNKMNCFNCYNNCSKIKEKDKIWPCLEKVTVEYAWNIIDKMIDKEVVNKNETK